MQSDAILCAVYKANYVIIHIKHTIHKPEKKEERIPKMSLKLKKKIVTVTLNIVVILVIVV